MKPIKNVFPASEGIAKSITQWTEVKAPKCWLDENETSKSGDKTPVMSAMF